MWWSSRRFYADLVAQSEAAAKRAEESAAMLDAKLARIEATLGTGAAIPKRGV